MLDGNDDYVQAPGFAFGGPMTICTHVQFDSFGTWTRVISANGHANGVQGGANNNIMIANNGGTPNLQYGTSNHSDCIFL